MDYYDYGFGGMLAAFAGAFLIVALLILAFGIVMWVLNAIGLMTLAKRRGLSVPWLVWIPFIGSYTLGAVADDVNEKEGGNTFYRYILLILQIISVIVAFVTAGDGGVGSLSWLVSLAVHVFNCIALNRIFKCYKPESATTYTVLCAIPILAFLQMIFPFVIRNNQPNWINPPQSGGYQGGYNPPPPPPQQGYNAPTAQDAFAARPDEPKGDPTGSGMFEDENK